MFDKMIIIWPIHIFSFLIPITMIFNFICYKYSAEVEMGTQGKGKDEFYLDIKDPQIATLDRKTGKITGLGEGETTVRILVTLIIKRHFYNT